MALPADTGIAKGALALRELLPATCLVQTDLLTFDFTCIARDEASLGQRRLERRIVVDQGAGNTVAHCTGLTRFTATVDVDLDVERFRVGGQLERLAHEIG